MQYILAYGTVLGIALAFSTLLLRAVEKSVSRDINEFKLDINMVD